MNNPNSYKIKKINRVVIQIYLKGKKQYIGKKLKLQVYDNQLYLYYSTNLVTIHKIQTQKFNYHTEHYAEISGMTFNKNSYEMIQKAKENLSMIGEVYKK